MPACGTLTGEVGMTKVAESTFPDVSERCVQDISFGVFVVIYDLAGENMAVGHDDAEG
jgi:hypothetical protein